MRRRDFMVALGGAAAMPFCARAQTPIPLVGFLRSTRQEAFEYLTEEMRAGLTESGYEVGRNVVVEYRWADERRDRLPVLADELIRKPAAVIVCNGVAAVTLKTATSTTPIVFVTGSDPVRD